MLLKSKIDFPGTPASFRLELVVTKGGGDALKRYVARHLYGYSESSNVALETYLQLVEGRRKGKEMYAYNGLGYDYPDVQKLAWRPRAFDTDVSLGGGNLVKLNIDVDAQNLRNLKKICSITGMNQHSVVDHAVKLMDEFDRHWLEGKRIIISRKHPSRSSNIHLVDYPPLPAK